MSQTGMSLTLNPALRNRLNPNIQLAKLGSIKILCFCVWIKNEACPIQVMANSSDLSFGKRGVSCCPERGVKRLGIIISEMKLRSCHFFRWPDSGSVTRCNSTAGTEHFKLTFIKTGGLTDATNQRECAECHRTIKKFFEEKSAYELHK